MLGILFIAALAGTVFPLTFFPGDYVVLGSFAVLLLVRLFGTWWGVLAALLAGSCTFAVWQHPFFAIIMVAEALIVGMLLRRGMQNILIADGFFWLFFGLPFLWIFNGVLLGAGGFALLKLLILYGFNGLGNALLATLILNFLIERHWERQSPPMLWETHFNLIVCAFLLPAVLTILLNTGSFRDMVTPDQAAKLADKTSAVHDELVKVETGVQEGLSELTRFAIRTRVRPSEELNRKIDVIRRNNPFLQQLFVADASGRQIASSTDGTARQHGGNHIAEEDLEKLRRLKIPVITEIRSGGLSHRPHLCWYLPIAEGERLEGLVGGVIDVAAIRLLLLTVEKPEDFAFTVIDHRGMIVASTDEELRSEENFYKGRSNFDRFFGSRAFLWYPQKYELASLPFWNSFLMPKLPEDGPLPWRIAVEVPRTEHLAHLRRVVGGTLAIMLLPALLSLGILPLMTRRLIGPLNQLIEATENLPEKVLNGQEIPWPKESAAEVRLLIENYRSVIAALEKNNKERESLKETSEEALDRVLTEKRWESFSASRQLQQEIGKRRRIEELLEHIEAAETKYRFLVENTLVGVYIVQDNRFVYVNPRFAEIFGFSPEEIVRNCNLLDVIDQADRAYVSGNFRRQFSGEVSNLQYVFRGRRKDGSIVHIESLNGMGTYNGRSAILGTLLDISERKKAEETVLHMAYHDPLTGLPNRLLFNDRAEQAMAMARRDDEVLALLFIDLDRFKAINDTLGHDAGDQLLKEVAERLRECIRDSDTVSRFGGDEFNLLLTKVRNESDVELVAHKILRVLRWPFNIGGQELHGSASIGIALFPRDGVDVQTLIKNADTALYRAKDLGRNNYQIFHTAMNAHALERMELENSLHKVLERRELRVYYQPQTSLHSGKIVGMEALLRWQHPTGGMIPPATFIPLAEEIGLIFPIGEWMMRSACRQAKTWQKEGFDPMRLGVNVSAQQFQDREFMTVLSQILEENNFPAKWLNVEITESVVMQDVRENILKLKQLHSFGITVAIDDFGIGYSSLSYLKDFPVDQLKLDRSFVQNLPFSENDSKIARYIVDMAHSIGLSVIAEGVENREQLDFLKKIGCDEVQGYLVSRPVPAEEFELLLKQQSPFPFLLGEEIEESVVLQNPEEAAPKTETAPSLPEDAEFKSHIPS